MVDLTMKECLLVLLLICVFKQCDCEELRFKINAPIDDVLVRTLDRVFQDAYQKFLQFIQEMEKNVKALGSKRVKDFRILTVDCFGILKGKTVNTLDELRDTMGVFSPAITKAITAGVCAVGELIFVNEKGLLPKLLTALEKFEYAQQIASNYFQMMSKF